MFIPLLSSLMSATSQKIDIFSKAKICQTFCQKEMQLKLPCYTGQFATTISTQHRIVENRSPCNMSPETIFCATLGSATCCGFLN